MDYAQEQRNPVKHLGGIAFVVAIHILVVYALVTGLARKVVEVVRAPLEARLVEEMRKAPPEAPPPPPPKLAPPPPAFVPPPEVTVAVQVPVAATISQVSTEPVAASPPRQVQRSPAVIDARQSCAKPEYPAVSKRLEEAGTVTLNFLIDIDGRVVDSKVVSSSGYQRLDQAARGALSLCRFKPGTADGKPERSWASINYTWELQ